MISFIIKRKHVLNRLKSNLERKIPFKNITKNLKYNYQTVSGFMNRKSSGISFKRSILKSITLDKTKNDYKYNNRSLEIHSNVNRKKYINQSITKINHAKIKSTILI